MKVFLVLNPGSKGGRSKKKFEKIFGLLKSFGVDFDYKITEKLEDAYTFSLNANKDNFDAIIAVGGDGTINNVINGFYSHEGKRISDALFGVIYTGTSPDFCKSYKIPLKLEDAVKNIAGCHSQKIKIGSIRFCKTIPENEDSVLNISDSVVKYFSCCVNIGLGASLARKANGGIRKYLGDFLGTFYSLIITIIQYKPSSYKCTYNDEVHSIDTCFNLSVGITPLIASGIKVPIKPDTKDLFYLMGACNLTLRRTLGVFKKVYSGKQFENNDSLWIEYTNEIEILGNKKNPEIEFDGDPAGYLPCSIRFANQELDVIVPLSPK